MPRVSQKSSRIHEIYQHTNAGKFINEHMILGCAVIKERIGCSCCVSMDLIIHCTLCWITQHLLVQVRLVLAQWNEPFKCRSKHFAPIYHLKEDSYRVNLVDEHAEVRHVRVVSTKVRVARFHATVICLLDFLRGCIWHLVPG